VGILHSAQSTPRASGHALPVFVSVGLAGRFADALSSSIISVQTSTHSSQMQQLGPAISLRTSFCDFLQNEHRRIVCSVVFINVVPL
jgi:hypothetical protein